LAVSGVSLSRSKSRNFLRLLRFSDRGPHRAARDASASSSIREPRWARCKSPRSISCRFSEFDPRFSGSDSDRQRHRPAHEPRQRCAWAPDHAVSPPGPPSPPPALSAVSDAPCSSARSGGRNHPTNPPTSRWLTLAARERPIPQRSWRRTLVSPRNSVVPAIRGRLARALLFPASVGTGVPRTTSRRSTTMTG